MGPAFCERDGMSHPYRASPLVALFSPSLCGGGAERVLVNLACGMVADGVSVDVVLASAKGPFLADLPADARVIDLKASRIAYSVIPLARYLRDVRPDALLGFLDHANIAAIAAAALSRSCTPVFVGIHNTWTEMHERGDRRLRMLSRIASIAYRSATAEIAVSHGAAASAERCLRLDPSKVRVIYNPVITKDLFSKAEAPAEHPWFAPGQPPVVLGVGRLTEQKQFATLVASFARLRTRCAARLMILGEGEDRLALEAFIRELGLSECVALPGFVVNPYPYMRSAAVFVLSSAYEGLPTVLIEALAIGAAIVSTDCPSGPSEILDNCRHGALVPVGNIEAMADAIYEALTSDRPERDADAWTNFTVPVATAAYLEAMLPPRPKPSH